VHALGLSWTDPEGVTRSMKEWAGGAGAEVAVLSFGGGADNPPSREGEPFELWWNAGGGLRTERQGAIEVRADGMLTTFHPMVGAVEQPEDRDQRRSIPLALSARMVLEQLDFRIVESSSWQGRPAWVINGSPSPGRTWRPPPWWAFDLPGREYLFHIDKATGIVVTAEGAIEDELVAWMRIDELEVDVPIETGVFQFRSPDGTPVRTPDQRALEHLAQQGVDVSGIDARDSEQVHEALRQHHESMFAMHRKPTVEQLAQDFPVLGPPPSDAAGAVIAVTGAFSRMTELSMDGVDLPMVERGQGLGDCVRAAGERYAREALAAIEVLHIKFVSDHEAVVWYAVAVNGHRILQQMEGRSVLTDDGWLVTRATFCQLMRLAGVTCPPPEGG